MTNIQKETKKCTFLYISLLIAVADTGFSQGAPTLKGKHYDFIKFSRKLHEIEKNLVAWGASTGGTSPQICHCIEIYIVNIKN